MSRRAKDRAEYDEAVRLIVWLRARGMEMVAAGETTNAQRVAVAANAITDLFTLPPAGTARERVNAWLAEGNESSIDYLAERVGLTEAEALTVLETLQHEGKAECVSASKLWRRAWSTS